MSNFPPSAMDESNSIPFEFDDCELFLASLDDNNSSKHTEQFQQQQQQQAQSFPLMNDYIAGAGVAPDMWTMAQQLPPQTLSNGTTSQPYLMNNQMNMEPSNFMVQPSNFYNESADSSNSSPLASPSMSINSISDSDTTGGYHTGSVLYPSSNTSAEVPNGQTITNNVPTDTTYSGLSSYPVSPPYPSAATDSSPGEPGTSPDEDYAYNDTAFQNFPQEGIKQEGQFDKSDKKTKQAKKSSVSGQKLNMDSKSNKVTKPRKEKTSHNMIEKRYRTNINDKILALRDCVPSLRCVVDGGQQPQSVDLEGLTPASKLNKATVLTKATEYILHLQKRNQMLLEQLHEFRQGRPVDMQLMMDMSIPPGMPAYPQGHPAMPPQNNGYASKAMMMSMAGIMGAGLMSDGSEMQSLAALPFFSFISSASIGPWSMQSLLFAFKFALVAGTILYLLAPSLFDSGPPAKALDHTQVDDFNTYSLREMRKQTWLTNTRSLDIPSETFSARIFAFLKSLAQILIINVLGNDSYTMIAGVFDKEQPNVKRIALSRAIEAQLCGGDEGSATRGRLFYTFVKSFILPPTPSRYLTQSIHVNVVCHDVYLLESVGAYFSKYLWNKARTAHEPSAESDDDETVVGKNIRALLDSTYPLENPEIIQRLYNIAHGRPLSDGCLTGEEDEGFLSVVTDKSIRSVADVLAALHANTLLHDVLIGVLESDEIDFDTLKLCAKIAPPRSVVMRRVAIAEALLLGPENASYAKNAMDMLKEELDQQDWVSHELAMKNTNGVSSHSRSNSHINHLSTSSSRSQTIVEDDDEDDITVSSRSSSIMSDDSFSESDSESVTTERGEDVTFLSSAVKTNTTPFIVSQDSRLGIRCSLIACYLARGFTGPAFTLMQNVEINKLENIGLLGFVAMWKVLCEMHERKFIVNRHKLEDLSAVARVWLGGNTGTQEGLSLSRLRQLVGDSVKMSKFFGGYDSEVDEGYGTQ